MTTNLFVKMSQRKINVAYDYEVAEDTIHVAQLQRMMMAEVLAGDESDYPDMITSWLDNSRQFGVSAAVALFPAWILQTNHCAFMNLSVTELRVFANNCEAMFYGEKFYYDDGCGIDAGAGVAKNPRELLMRSVLFSQCQCYAGFTAEDIQRFFDAGVISESNRDDMLAELANAD